ncbi:hypothetical protein [Luteolibacter soli]|uniref:Uncharacterized protein n=1 Tax=Luteolibacter soli TaxID=3135280 RepID=A0ABU9AV65_9BACT
MKLFSAICGTTALLTSGGSFYLLSRFAVYFGKVGIPLPMLTEAVLWKGGVVPPALLLGSAIIVFTGVALKDKSLMIAGSVCTLLLMLVAATVVPAALMLPMEKMAHEGETGLMSPSHPQPHEEKHPIHD